MFSSENVKNEMCIVVLARLQSQRIPRKPLAQVGNKSLIQLTIENIQSFANHIPIYVATDSDEVMNECKRLGVHSLITDPAHPNPLNRAWEASLSLRGYRSIAVFNGDEPSVSATSLERLVADQKARGKAFYCSTAYTLTKAKNQVIDSSNIKLVTDSNDNLLYASRACIPCQYTAGPMSFKKFCGIGIFTHESLDFFHHAKEPEIEAVERVSLLRYIYWGKPVSCVCLEGDSFSVDTPEDLEAIIRTQLYSGHA